MSTRYRPRPDTDRTDGYGRNDYRKEHNRLPVKSSTGGASTSQSTRRTQSDRDAEIFTDYVDGLPVREIAIKYDISLKTVHNAVQRHREESGVSIPSHRQLVRLRRMRKRVDRYQRRLDYLRTLTPEQQQHHEAEAVQYRVFLDHVNNKSTPKDLAERYGMAEVSINLIIKRLAK